MSFSRGLKFPKKGRRPQMEAKVKETYFKEEWPMKLKNHVSTRKGTTKEAACLKETLAFITCLKNTNNVQELCTAQAEAVRHCYHSHLANQEAKKKRAKSARDFAPEISAKDMDPYQLNRFLKHFPHKLKDK